MLDRSATIALLTVGLALAIASGAGFVPGGDGTGTADQAQAQDPEQLVTSMLTESPDSVEGQFYEEIRHNDSTVNRTVYNVAMRPPSDRQRITIVRPAEGNLTLVQNETTAWIYDAGDNEVLRHDVGQSEGDIIVPALEYEYYNDLVEDSNLTYRGTERVAGREAHVVVFTDPSEGRSSASIDLILGDEKYQLAATTLEKPLLLSEHRLWIDTEHDYPIKKQTTLIGQDNESVTYTSRYDRIDFEPDTDAGTFQFDPPESAESHASPELDSREYASVEAARSAVPYAVPDPTVPGEYELQTVRVAQINGTTRTTLEYSDGTDSLRVRVLPGFDHDVRGMSVTVGDRQGTLTGGQGATGLYWQCDGRMHVVHADSGTVSPGDQLAVAESIECP